MNIEQKILALLKFLSKKKLILAGVVLVVIIILGFLFIQNNNKRSGYVFGNVEKTSLSEVVSESGVISSSGSIPVFSTTNGTVSEIYIENGQNVAQNQKLFKVTSSATEQEKKSSYANYLAAKTTLDSANANMHTLQSAMFSAWKTYTDLATNSTYENSDGSPNTTNRTLPEFTTAQNNWFAAEENFINQQNVIAQDQASVESAYTTYMATQTTVVVAPLEGTAENISFAKGSSVHAQNAINPNIKPALVIRNNEALEGEVAVGQTNIAKIKLGQDAIIKPDAYKDKKYDGTVVRVDTVGQNVQGVVTYSVYIKTANDKFLKPGMTFDADIITQKLENVLTVPNSAVVIEDGQKNVRIFQNGKLRSVPVIVGVKGETRTQILKGLSEGQEIVVALTNIRAEKPGFLGL